MAHSQKSIRDHARNRTHPNVDNQAISQQLENLVKPCVYNQLAYYRGLEMRARILSLPLMLAAVLTLVWRQVPSVRELNRMLAREDLLWATWLFYAVLIDLADEVADELALPTNSISTEMLFRGIYHLTQAASQGSITDLIAYFSAPENRDLGIVKSPRVKRAKPPLNLSPFPA